jgi:hypothetical protein
MRRFRNGATQRPIFNRPGVAYGQYCYGAPGPTREVEHRRTIVPEMFIENSEQPLQQTYFIDDHVYSGKNVKSNKPQDNNIKSKTIIDLRDF